MKIEGNLSIETLHVLTEKQLRQRAAAAQGTRHAIVAGIKVPVLMSQEEVAFVMGVSQMTISNIEKSAISKLAKGLRG